MSSYLAFFITKNTAQFLTLARINISIFLAQIYLKLFYRTVSFISKKDVKKKLLHVSSYEILYWTPTSFFLIEAQFQQE